MELFSGPWFGSLISIILIDLVLAGDNAVVIALAARSLPAHMQRAAVLWGTVGAIVIRVVAAVTLVFLLRVPGIKAVGALLLFWIAYRLVHDNHDSRRSSAKERAGVTFLSAMGTIVFADAIMGLDNILAIAGAARGDILLVAIGLIISIPIVIGGSMLILHYIQNHPWIVWVGGALLGYTGGAMLTDDSYVATNLLEHVPQILIWMIKLLPTVVLFWLGWWFHRRSRQLPA